MSTALYWRPAPKDEPPPDSLSDHLKRILARRFWDHDGSLYADTVTMTRDDLAYVEGLKDAMVADANVLYEAIKEHGDVEIWISE